MARGAADERDDGRRGHAPARVPRHPAPTSETAALGRVDPLPAARRRHAGRTSPAGPATCRRRSRPTGRCALAGDDPAEPSTCARAAEFIREQGGLERGARVHAHLAGAVRAVVVGRRAGAAARDRAAAARGSRSTSTTSRAGRARRSSRCRSCAPTGRSGRCRSTLDELRPRRRRRRRPADVAGRPRCRSRSTALLRVYERRPIAPAAPARRCARPSAGSCGARRPTARWGGIQPPWVYSLMALHLQRLSARPPGDASRASRGSTRSRSRGRRRACAVARGVPVAGVGHRAGADRAAPTPACRPTIRRSCAPAEWLLGEEVTVSRRLGGAPAAARARRLGVRVRERQLPRRRRHRRGGARAARASRHPDSERVDDGRSPRAVAWMIGMQSARRRLGRVRRRQHARARPRAAVLRLRRGDRPAERRRHRARGRDARRSSAGQPARDSAARGCAGCSTSRSPTARGSGAGASTTSTAPAARAALSAAGVPRRPTRAIRRAVDWLERPPERGRRLGRGLPLLRRPGLDRARREHRLADRVGAARAARRRRGAVATRPLAGVGWLMLPPSAPDGTLGRAAVHRHRLPLRLLHQLPPLPAHLPRDGARPLPGGVASSVTAKDRNQRARSPPRAPPPTRPAPRR